MLAGIGVRRWKPAWVATHRGTLRNLCLAGIACLLVYLLVNRWTQVAGGWRQTALAGLAFVAAALVVGLALARLLRLSASDSITVGIVFAVRNVALAGAIAVSLLNRIGFAEAAAVYFLIEVPLLLSVVGAYRRWWTPPPLGPPASARV